MNGSAKEQDFTPLLRRHLDALRSSPDYRRFLGVVVEVCKHGPLLPEQRLARVADTVLRPIADDLSNCVPGNRLAIFHMAVVNEQS